jgi:phosphinothricin acetyltransferase
MEIRLARQEDLPIINEIYNQAVRQRFCTAHLLEIDMEERTAWFRIHDPGQWAEPTELVSSVKPTSQARYPVYVALSSQAVTGWVSLGPYRMGRQALAHVAEVSYYVDKQNRGEGTGNRLMEHAIRVAPQFGFSVLIAILLNKNPASIGLLKRFGYERWGAMPGIALIDGQEADHLYYGLKL